ITVQQDSGERFAQFAAQPCFGGVPGIAHFNVAAPHSCTNIADQTSNPAKRTIHIDGNCRAEVLNYQFTLFGIAVEQALVDDYCDVFVCAQETKAIVQSFCDMDGLVRCNLQCSRTFLCAVRGNDKEDHAVDYATSSPVTA